MTTILPTTNERLFPIKRIYDNQGRLTEFGLSLGFVERRTHENLSVTMWYGTNDNNYHVRVLDVTTGSRISSATFRLIDAARTYYDAVELHRLYALSQG